MKRATDAETDAGSAEVEMPVPRTPSRVGDMATTVASVFGLGLMAAADVVDHWRHRDGRRASR